MELEFGYVEEVTVQVFKFEEKVSTHLYKGESKVSIFKPTDRVDIRILTNKAVRSMKFQPKLQR